MRLVPIQHSNGADSKRSDRNRKSIVVAVVLVTYLISLALYTSKLHVDTSHMEGSGAFGVDMDVALLPLLFPSDNNHHHRSLHEKTNLQDWIPHIQRRQRYVQKVLETVPMDVQNKSLRLPGSGEKVICNEKLKQYGTNVTILNELMEFQDDKKSRWTKEDSDSTPASTKPKPLTGTNHAIVIPFRDRDFHLQNFQKYMSSYFQHHYSGTNHTFKLYIVDQDDAEPFQRGFLMNAALDHLDMDVACVTMHDVDLVPIYFSKAPYHDCLRPTRLINSMQTFDWKIPYERFFGAIVSLHQQHWAVINGMGNQFRGWGAEDDELYTRLVYRGLVDCKTSNPGKPKDPNHGTFMAISQEKEHHHGRVKGPDYTRNCAIMDRHKWAGVSNSIIDGWSLNKYEVTSHTVQYTADDPILKGFQEIHKIRVVNRIEWIKAWKRPASLRMQPRTKTTTNAKKATPTISTKKKTPAATISGLASQGKAVKSGTKQADGGTAVTPKTSSAAFVRQVNEKQSAAFVRQVNEKQSAAAEEASTDDDSTTEESVET